MLDVCSQSPGKMYPYPGVAEHRVACAYQRRKQMKKHENNEKLDPTKRKRCTQRRMHTKKNAHFDCGSMHTQPQRQRHNNSSNDARNNKQRSTLRQQRSTLQRCDVDDAAQARVATNERTLERTRKLWNERTLERTKARTSERTN